MKYITLVFMAWALLLNDAAQVQGEHSKNGNSNNSNNSYSNRYLRDHPASASASSPNHIASMSSSSSSSASNQSRHLSVWASFLHFIRCPPGPLGNRPSCQNDGYNNGGDGEGNNNNNNNNNKNNNRSSGWSWSSSNSNNNNANGADGDNNNGSGRTWSNWFTGGSGVNNGDNDGAAENEQYGAANVVRVGSFPWFVMVFGLTALATGAGYMTYQTSKNEDGVASVQTLKEKVMSFYNQKFGNNNKSTAGDYKLSQDTTIA